MAIQYDVDKDGSVIRVTQVKGEAYTINPLPPVAAFPIAYKEDRWASFKRTVAKQEPNIIIPYAGFPNKEELKRAKSLFAKQDNDVFFKAALNGSVLVAKADVPTLTLYVERQKK